MFEEADSLIEFARRRGLNPPLDPQPTELSTEGRAVPDYGAPLNFLFFHWAHKFRGSKQLPRQIPTRLGATRHGPNLSIFNKLLLSGTNLIALG